MTVGNVLKIIDNPNARVVLYCEDDGRRVRDCTPIADAERAFNGYLNKQVITVYNGDSWEFEPNLVTIRYR